MCKCVTVTNQNMRNTFLANLKLFLLTLTHFDFKEWKNLNKNFANGQRLSASKIDCDVEHVCYNNFSIRRPFNFLITIN